MTEYSQMADCLLDGYSTTQPRWHTLSRNVKHALLARLGIDKYRNIHDPVFYQDLDRTWTKRQEDSKDSKEKEVIECSICLDTYDIGGKVTTLLCGHTFCTNCVMGHISHHFECTSCPLCRANIFEAPTPPPEKNDENSRIETNITYTGAKAQKRKMERFNKRQRKRNNI